MRIFNWMFNKHNRQQDNSKPDHAKSSVTCSDMNIQNTHTPESLLSIGTFGTCDSKAENISLPNIAEPNLSDFTFEEVATLVKKLENIRVERLNLSSGDDKCLIDIPNREDYDYKRISGDSEIVLSKGKELLKKKSISVFIKNVFACKGGFAPVLAPELRDPFSQSRMEKLLKSLLRKKVYPQNATAMPTNKHLQRKHENKLSIESATHDKGDDGEKWVKTDSEYIVLEI